MKIAIISSLMILSAVSARAQNCDIAQTGMAVMDAANSSSVNAVLTGQEINFKFSVANFGSSMSCAIPANSVTAILDFPSLPGGTRPYIYNGPSTFVSGYFTWTYSVADEQLRGVNTTSIPSGQGDAKILVKVKAIAPGTAQSSLTLTQANGTPDNNANNVSSARVIITGAPLPIKLAAFTAIPENCDVIISWATLSELNSSHFDIEYSPDAVNFITVSTVNSKDIPTGSSYRVSYTPLNGSGYYRLKMVDKDDKFEYSNTIRANTSCSDKARVLVYPNPVSGNRKLIVNISGYTGKIRGELFNAAGQKVSDHILANKANELSVMNLGAGVYMLYIKSENGEKQSFRVVVTN